MVIEENPLVFSHDGTCCVLQVEPVHTQIHLLSSIRPPQTIIITSVFQAESRATGNGSQTRLRGDEGEEGKVGKT